MVLLAPPRDAQGAVVDARIEFADEAWRAKLAAGADPTGHLIRSYLGDDGERFEAIARAADRRESVQAVFHHPVAHDRIAEVQLTPIADRVLATGREVTSERALRGELEKSRAELLAAQKLAQMGSWVWDPRTDRAEWSDAMLAIYGLPPGSPSPSFAEQRRFYDEQTIAQTATLIERVTRTGEPYSMEYDLTRDDGERRHVIAHGESVRVGGEFFGLRGTVVDITELHEVREALRRSERRFATVLESVRESVAILRPERDAEGEVTALRIEWVNEPWHALWGIDHDVVGQDAYALLPMLAAYRAVHRDVLDTGSARDLSVQRPDGRVVEATVAAMGDRLVAVGRDVTALRRAQGERDEKRRAEQLVALAGGIAHQFNNALTAIVGHAEQLHASVPTEQHEDLRSILDATERAAVLTRHLLAYAQRQALRPASFAIDPFVRRVRPLLGAAAGEGIAIEVAPGDPRVAVEFDPQQLELAVLELVRNARDAMPRGGTIRITTRAEPPFVLLSVADTGRGVAPEDLPRIFEPFFTGGRFGERTGLGLSSVQGTMRQSGGRVTVESVPGHGAVFTLHLPQAAAVGSTPPSDRSDVDAAGEVPARVLVVDDDPLVRRIVARSLRGLGCDVSEAASGDEALALLSEREIDVLLTDVTMPEMTGGALAEHATARCPNLTVVFMSGYAAAALEADGSLPPGATFLAKPFGRSTLRRVVALARRAGTAASRGR